MLLQSHRVQLTTSVRWKSDHWWNEAVTVDANRSVILRVTETTAAGREQWFRTIKEDEDTDILISIGTEIPHIP